MNDEKEFLLTFPCVKPSQNKLIKDIEILINSKEYSKIFETIKTTYSKAPYYIEIILLLEDIFNKEYKNISELASASIIIIAKYLNLETEFLFSSISFKETKGQNREERLVNITKKIGSNHYINAIGGQAIYNQDSFLEKGIKLNFLEPGIMPYAQYSNEFVPGLSIIDVLMFNSVTRINEMLNEYKLL